MKTKTLIIILISAIASSAIAQKKVLDHEVYNIWRSIENSSISADGKTVAYDLVFVGEGNPTTMVRDATAKELVNYERGSKTKITYDSKFVTFKISPDLNELKELRRQKVEKDDLPKDSLGIYNIKSGELMKIGRVMDYKVPQKWSGWIAYRLESEAKSKKSKDKEEEESEKKEEPKEKEKKPKAKKESKDNGYRLIVRNLASGEQDTIKYVTSYSFAEKGAGLVIETTGEEDDKGGIMVFDFAEGSAKSIMTGKGKYNKLTWDEQGTKLAFVADLDTTKVLIRPFGLYYWNSQMNEAVNIANNDSNELPDNWLVSEHNNLRFAKDGSKLFFGTAPHPVLQDTTLLKEEIVNVEVWSYNDTRLHTQQKIEKKDDQQKSYTAVYHVDSKKIVQLGNEDMPDISFGDEGNANWVLASNPNPYMKAISWEGFPVLNDFYLVNTTTGDQVVIAKKIRGNARFSPNANYVYWGNADDSVMYTYSVKDKKIQQVTNNKTVKFYDERNDSPTWPRAYGIMSWTENDERVLIYDRYDIWEFDPSGKVAPIMITKAGRTSKTVYRYRRLDDEERFIKKNQKLVLTSFNETDKSEELLTYTYKKGNPVKFIGEKTRYSRIIKARDNNSLIYTQESFKQFPDIRLIQIGKSKSTQISNVNPQQAEYNWGTNELVHFTSLDGKKLEGMLIKPENFDPNKKYPMIVNFYERSADGLNRHRLPSPGRSTISYSFYASRGYLVFNPDIVYRIGYPGESAYNSVVAGITHLIDQGFVDEDNIAAQGHSWGGYQVAYLVTQTDIFKCVEAGAPVPNMISAYGGIRWWSGLSRMFQYEHTQTRIGGTLWEYPLRYIENSPIFFVDKINTPVLIMHNDADGHVPWYQGIEFFVSLRRLNKPSWMLNYQGGAHWPRKLQNRIDFNIRLQQYFDHYLKGAPMPDWMQNGVPAIDVGINQHLELLDK